MMEPMPPTTERVPRWLISPALGVVVGLLGGVLGGGYIAGSRVAGALVGAAFGIILGLLLRERAGTLGSGLIWGIASALLLWLTAPAGATAMLSGLKSPATMLHGARTHFPELVAYVILLGAPLGLVLSVCRSLLFPARGTSIRWSRAIIVGGTSGTLSGLVFSRWMYGGEFFPLLGGLNPLGSRKEMVVLHFLIAFAIGAIFGLLFQQEVRGFGSSMAWGLSFAMFWWFLGPLTLFPLKDKSTVDWSAEQGTALFGAFVGHLIYGLLLGVIYAAVDRFWLKLFVESDPVNRAREGPGVRIGRSLAWGGLAGFLGGVAASPVLLATGVLPVIAGLDTRFSTARALFVHLLVSTAIGMVFGLLFRKESPNLGLGLNWGWLFGLIWWYVGPMTLLPLLLTGVCDWTADAASSLLPSLIGHLVYGAVTALIFLLLEGRYERWLLLDLRTAARESSESRLTETSLPALWFFVISVGVLLPILLG